MCAKVNASKQERRNEMGLDVRSYNNVEFVCDVPENVACKWTWFEENFDYDTHTIVWFNNNFPKQFEGLKEGVYKYSKTPVSDYPRWSYSGYNTFRDMLAQSVGYAGAQDCWNKVTLGFDGNILADLIHFSDCEGYFGTESCKRIYEDLKKVDISFFDGGTYYLRQLKLLIEVFKDAAENNGIVEWC